MTILDEIAQYARERIMQAKKSQSFDDLYSQALNINNDSGFRFEAAIETCDDIAFICECKKASPSKGLIAPDFDYVNIAIDYENSGASAISVLTEPKYFLGKNEYLSEIVNSVKIPVLRKDFVVDEYMILEAKILGASAILLIVSILNDIDILKNYINLCDKLGLSALVEAHDENEINTAINAGARIIGVNNRNLKDFSVDFENSRRLREIVPDSILFIAESGIKTRDDVRALRKIGVDGVLIGETLMKSHDKRKMIEELRS